MQREADEAEDVDIYLVCMHFPHSPISILSRRVSRRARCVADFAQLYSSWLPPGASTGINRDFFTNDWGLKYLDTDPESHHRNPPSVMVPSGPGVDLAHVSAGSFPYDPAKIKVPTMVIYGEWDAIATEAGGKRLFDELAGAQRKTRFVIGHGTHLLQFEQVRFEAYAAVRLSWKRVVTLAAGPPDSPSLASFAPCAEAWNIVCGKESGEVNRHANVPP